MDGFLLVALLIAVTPILLVLGIWGYAVLFVTLSSLVVAAKIVIKGGRHE